jgi:hypothetical protein
MFKKILTLGLGGSFVNYTLNCCGIVGVLTTDENAE